MSYFTAQETQQYHHWRDLVLRTIKQAQDRNYIAVIEPAKTLLLFVDRQRAAVAKGLISRDDRTMGKDRSRRVRQVIELFAYYEQRRVR